MRRLIVLLLSMLLASCGGVVDGSSGSHSSANARFVMRPLEFTASTAHGEIYYLSGPGVTDEWIRSIVREETIPYVMDNPIPENSSYSLTAGSGIEGVGGTDYAIILPAGLPVNGLIIVVFAPDSLSKQSAGQFTIFGRISGKANGNYFIQYLPSPPTVTALPDDLVIIQ